MESLQWLLLNADKISVIGLLVGFVVALQRRWVVMGWIYADCIIDRDKFEQRVEAIAAANEAKVSQLGAEVEILREQLQRGRAG